MLDRKEYRIRVLSLIQERKSEWKESLLKTIGYRYQKIVDRRIDEIQKDVQNILLKTERWMLKKSEFKTLIRCRKCGELWEKDVNDPMRFCFECRKK